MKNYWDKFAPFYNLSRRVEKKAYNQMYALIRETIKGKDERWEQMKSQNIKLDFAQADATALPYCWNLRRSTVINASFPLSYVECTSARIC